MDAAYKRFAPAALVVGLLGLLAAAGIWLVQRQFNTYVQASLAVGLLGLAVAMLLNPNAVQVWLRGRQAHVNLIPFNDVSGLSYRSPTPQAVADFVEVLKSSKVSVKVRKRKGADIDAACGQLRRAAKGVADGAEPSPAAGV